MPDEEYRYKGLPLTPVVIEFLILELFSGQTVERRKIVAEVVRTHLARGGKKADAQSVSGVAKKALKSLERKGLAENHHIAIGESIELSRSQSLAICRRQSMKYRGAPSQKQFQRSHRLSLRLKLIW